MTDHKKLFRQAEKTFLESEGLEAEPEFVDLPRLGGTARVVTTGDGPPVLMVPGVMSTGVAFAGLARHLPDYHCIMIDRPGTGLSPVLPTPPTDLAKQQHAADNLLVDLLDGLGIERSHVICTSMGGWTTFRSAAAHPDRFNRISAIAWQMGARMTGVPWSMRLPIPKALIPKRLKASPKMIRSMLAKSGMRSAIENGGFSDEMINYMAALMSHTETFGNDSRYSPRGWREEALHSADLLSEVTAAVHLFWGTDDPFGTVEAAREFVALLPNAELQLVDGAGHSPWMDEPELAITAVRNHLGGNH